MNLWQAELKMEKEIDAYQVHEIYYFSQIHTGFECKYQRNKSRQNVHL